MKQNDHRQIAATNCIMDPAEKKFTFLSVLIFTLARLSVLAEVRSPPYFIQQPTKTEEIFLPEETDDFHQTQPFYLPCEAEGNPAPSYFWTKNGQRFNWTSEGNRIFQVPGRGTLIKRIPEPSDAGQYQCFAENIWGTATSNSIILVSKTAQFEPNKNETIVKQAIEGFPYHLSCDAPDGYPKPSFHWITQNSSGLFTSINNTRISEDPTGTLWFSNITREDAGEDSYYVCFAVQSQINTIRKGTQIKLQVVPANSSQINNIAPIRQYISARVQVAVSNRTTTLYCIFGGTPLPTTTWQKNGISLKNNGPSLVIKRTSPADEGSYTCLVNNGVGDSISHTIDLKVQVEPYFIKPPKSITTAEDETVEFHCEAAGNPTPTITWIHNGKPLSEASFNPRRAISSNSIIIERVQLNDTGNYGCNASNPLGYVYQDVYVNVLAEPPKIVIAERNLVQETVEDTTVEVSCRATGWPAPRITWMKNGTEVAGNRFKTTKYGDLTINNITFADAGVYTCLAQNTISSDSVAVNVIVRKRTLIPPGFGPSDVTVQVGKPATFRCSALGDESLPRSINWLRKGELIDFASERRHFQSNDNSLVILSTTKMDSGKYACLALTPLDSVTAEATLTVQ